MMTDHTTTIRNKGLLELAVEEMDKAGKAYDRAYLKWFRNRNEPNLRVLEQAAKLYKQTQRTYQAARLVVKYNHSRMPTVASQEVTA